MPRAARRHAASVTPTPTRMSGRDPEGLFPCVLGHEGAGIVEEVGRGRHVARAGRSRRSRSTCPSAASASSVSRGKTNLCSALRDNAGQGPDARRHEPPLAQGPDAAPLHGHVDVRGAHRACPRSRSRRSAPTRRSTRCACSAAASRTGIGAVLYTAKVEPGAIVAVFGLGGIGLSVIQGAVLAGAERIIAIDTNPEKFALATQFGATDTLEPARHREPRRGDRRAHGRRRRLLVRVHRQRRGDGPGARRCAHHGWGQSIIIGVAGAGEEIHARPFLLVTGPLVARHGVRRRARAARSSRSSSTATWRGGSSSTSTSPRRAPLDEINHAFDLMHAGEAIRSVIMYEASA